MDSLQKLKDTIFSLAMDYADSIINDRCCQLDYVNELRAGIALTLYYLRRRGLAEKINYHKLYANKMRTDAPRLGLTRKHSAFIPGPILNELDAAIRTRRSPQQLAKLKGDEIHAQSDL